MMYSNDYVMLRVNNKKAISDIQKVLVSFD